MRRNSSLKIETVGDCFPDIDPYYLETLSKSNSYYLKCFNFVEQVWDRNVKTLSQAQVRWLSKINEDMASMNDQESKKI